MDRNARLGLIFFAVYTAVYTGFVLLSAFWPEALGWPVISGMNLAVAYGVFLIVFAFLMAAVYGWLCSNDANQSHEVDS